MKNDVAPLNEIFPEFKYLYIFEDLCLFDQLLG